MIGIHGLPKTPDQMITYDTFTWFHKERPKGLTHKVSPHQRYMVMSNYPLAEEILAVPVERFSYKSEKLDTKG